MQRRVVQRVLLIQGRPSSDVPAATGTLTRHSAFPAGTATHTELEQPDPYYGHEEVARTCTHFVMHLFACPEVPPTSANPGSSSPPLPLFIAYALHRTRLHHSVTFAALYLLLRFKSRFPAARGSSGHRLFISAFMLASKVICEDTYSNKSWSIVAQSMFALREINQMEREMCSYLEWQLNVDPMELHDFEKKVRADFKGQGPYPSYDLPSPAPAPSPMPSSTPYASDTTAPPPSFVTGRVPPPFVAYPTARPAHVHARSTQPIPIPTHHHPERTYATPPKSPHVPDTPKASYSASTSPASSASPPTPPSKVDLTLKIATPGEGVPMSVDPRVMQQQQKVAPGPSAYCAAPQVSCAAPRRARYSELFATVQPVAW